MQHVWIKVDDFIKSWDKSYNIILIPPGCHRFGRKQVLYSWKNWIMSRIIWMILGRNLQYCRNWLVIAIYQKPDHVCNLKLKKISIKNNNNKTSHMSLALERKGFQKTTYILTNHHYCNILPCSELFESIFNLFNSCLWNIKSSNIWDKKKM